jgi:hypothetical protein
MKKQVLLYLLIILLVTALGLIAYQCRKALRERAFELTGEEGLASQAGGLAQLALNLTYPPLDLQPYAPVEYVGVNPFGINTFLHQEVEPAKREEQVRLIAEAGFHWIRQEFSWQDIEIHGRGDFIDRRNDPAGIDAWAKYDHIVDLTERYGLEIIARITSPPAWSRAAGDAMGTFAPPDDYDDYARFAALLAERYQGRIRYYQIWNEPNIYPEWGEQNVSPEQYTDLLCRAYHAIKAVDPEAVILSGALAPNAELSGRNFNDYLFLQRMYDAGAGECFDILSMQGYGLWSGPTDHRMRPLIVNYARVEFIRDIMVRNGDADKAIWISEMNWNAAPEDVEPRYGRVSLEQQARYAPLAYQRAQEEWPWVGVIAFWYFKRADDQWLSERRPEAYFQMAAPDFTLMPVYDTMREYIHQTPVMYRGNHTADHWAVTQRDGLISFSFVGTSLTIRYDEPAHDTLCGASLSVDGRVIQATACSGEIVWRGPRGRHTAEYLPLNGATISRIIVRDDVLNLPAILLLTAGVLVGGGMFWVYRRRRRQAVSTTRGEETSRRSPDAL